MPPPPRLKYPDRVLLARLPTPLERLERVSDRLGVEVLVKRDDLTGADLGGNKVRKLEFLLADAVSRGCDTVVTLGGEQSNHCRATALACARLGLRAHLLLRTVDPGRPPAATANILLDRIAGAEIRWISMADWKRRDELLAEVGEELGRAGRLPYLIPEGGSSALGAWGYVRAAVEELDPALAALPGPTTVLYACGSGGTGAGLVLGAALCGWRERGIRVAGVNVCDDRDYFVRVIGGICRDFDRLTGAGAAVEEADIDIVDGHVGLGYGKSRPEELRELIDLGRREGIVLDPVYTGKAYAALVDEVTRDRDRFGPRIVFLHTGGIFGLFPAADQMAALLD
ncbi:MAG TPA: D-cysteine desulfhydrase family protein [Candidatus Acidoferrum sp.]|nr:D-cysteine desulfhydrase family protein [Candidatus Acidoferrum sp.]